MSVSMLSEQLVRCGIYTDVYTTTANGKHELPVRPGKCVTVDGVKVTYFKRLTKDHSHYSPALVKSLWKNCIAYDLIHVHAWWNLVSVLSCMIALMRNVPVLLSPRGTLSQYSFNNKNIGIKWGLHNFLGKYLLNKCHFHVTSKNEDTAITKILKPKSVTNLPNFVSLPMKGSLTKTEDSITFKLLFLSRIEEKKGLDILISALSMVTVPYHLTIAGTGAANYLEALKLIAVNNHVDDRISWVGFYSENKFKLLQDHDLFILPSHDENFGNAVIESLSVGTPVLISEQVGLAEYVTENNLGWICQTNVNSVGKAINNIANNSQADLERIRKNAPDVIYDDFDSGNLAKKYVDMYKKLIKI